jgi:hypothetical protein
MLIDVKYYNKVRTYKSKFSARKMKISNPNLIYLVPVDFFKIVNKINIFLGENVEIFKENFNKI